LSLSICKFPLETSPLSRYCEDVQVISIINQKGGVGKTTASVNIAAALAASGVRSLIVDLDPQAHLSISLDRLPEPGAPSVYTLMSGTHSVEEVVQSTAQENLFVAPTNLDLTGAETEFASEIGRESILRDALKKFSKSKMAPEVVILDCPPSLGLLSLNALVCSQYVIIPLQAEFFALQGMAQLLDVVERVKRRLNPGLDLLGILVSMFQKQRNLSREVLDELHSHFGDLVFKTLVRVNVRLAEAPSHGQTIYEYAPESAGADDFAALAGEVAHRLGLVKTEEPQTQAPVEPLAEMEAG
jgi:chromosome partitioning protein